MTSTIFDKNAYDDGIRDAIGKVTDDWAFRFPGRLIIPSQVPP